MFDFIQAAAMSMMILTADPVQCSVPAAPVIEVIPSTTPLYIDYTKSSAQLGQFHADTISPYSKGADVIRGGLTKSQLKLSAKTQLGLMTWPSLEVFCMYYSKIRIEISLDPRVYIANDYRKGTCLHDSILEHEKKHVDVDRQVVNKYSAIIGEQIRAAIVNAGAIGPYKMNRRDDIQELMLDNVNAAVQGVRLQMLEEQSRRQQGVDTLEEYQRVSEACGGRGRRR